MTTSEVKAPAAPVPTLELEADDAALDKALKSGTQTTGGFDGPAWVPYLTEAHMPDLKPEAIALKVKKAGPGSTTVQKIAGTLVLPYAWGRPIYMLDVKAKDGSVVRVKLPEQTLLWTGLNPIELGAKVAIRYDGKGKAKGDHSAPHLYTCVSVDKPTLAPDKARKLKPLSQKEREELRKKQELEAVKAQNAAAGIAAPADAGDNSGDLDDDTPF